jgi:hypothetical protein
MMALEVNISFLNSPCDELLSTYPFVKIPKTHYSIIPTFHHSKSRLQKTNVSSDKSLPLKEGRLGHNKVVQKKPVKPGRKPIPGKDAEKRIVLDSSAKKTCEGADHNEHLRSGNTESNYGT